MRLGFVEALFYELDITVEKRSPSPTEYTVKLLSGRQKLFSLRIFMHYGPPRMNLTYPLTFPCIPSSGQPLQN